MYGGVFLSDPDLRYENGIRIPDKFRVDVDELHVMLFHNLATDLDVEKIETFWCRVNKKGYYYKLENYVDVLSLISSLKYGDLVDAYVVHQISEPILVNDDVAATPPLLQLSNGDVAAPVEPDRADVSSSLPLDINKDEYTNENQPPKAKKGKAKVSCEDLGEGEIPFGSVDIDAGFEDICKNKGVRYEGKLGGVDPYFNSSDLGSDISDEKEGDPIDDDEMVDLLPRTFSCKIYFDKTAKKVCFQLYMVFLNVIEFREALQSYSIQNGVNHKLKPNEKKRVRAKCKHKGCPWVILGSIDNTGFFTVKTYFPIHKCSKRTRNKMYNPLWISKHYKDRIMSDPSIKLHQIQALLRKDYGLYVSKTTCRKAKIKIMNEHFGDFVEEFSRLYDYVEQLRTTNPGTTVFISTSKNAVLEKEVFMGIYICLGALKSGWKEGCRRIVGLDGAFLKGVCKAKCEVRFNGDMSFEIGDPPYTHVVNVKRKQCSCRSTRPPIEPPEITPVPGRPGKNRKKAKDEAVKKKFGKATRKRRKMTYSVCKCIGHNKKGCPTLEKDFSSSCGSQPSVQASTSTAAVVAERDANASTAEEMPVNAKSSNRRPAGRPSNAQSAPTCSGRPANAHSAPTYSGRPTNAHSAPTAAGRHANAVLVGGMRPARASTTDIRPATIVMSTTISAVGATTT
ncbi:putative (+)-neomenthol dehydrogenase-like [Capsicum annuum]|nr:putative (+)-neomenthol dehydrogenase-like [Capsicum annuum]